jgi:hypothetical protein
MRHLRRRYGRAEHGPSISWQGTDYIERRVNNVHNKLVAVILGDTHGTKRSEYIGEGEAVLTWLLSMKTKGAGARGKRFLEHKINEMRRLVHKAEAT